MKSAVLIPIPNETQRREDLGEMKFAFGTELEEVCVAKIDFGPEVQRDVISEGRSRIEFYHYKECILVIKGGPKWIFKEMATFAA